MGKKKSPDPEYIVAIGASAGGIDAIQLLIENLPSDLPICFIIAQHLSPSHPSALSEIINLQNNINSITVKRSRKVKSRAIFVTPPNKDIEYQDGKIKLLTPSKELGNTPSVDRLFHSLAEHCPSKAIGIVLSGSGHDGATGLKAIVKAGGHAIIQEPETAKYSHMPKAAIQALESPVILTPTEISTYLHNLCSGIEREEKVIRLPEVQHQELVRLISATSNTNLTHFKKTTLERRILRRMVILGIRELNQYLDFIRHNPNETKQFTESLSIATTEFFRDKQTFKALAAYLKKQITPRTLQDEPFRIWVIGCSTGQEAYSIAILMESLYRDLELKPDYQIFATDISEKLIAEARTGSYNVKLSSELDDELVEQHFDKQLDQISIKKEIRERVYFSVHNVVSDPPFSKMDFISCRNVAIYLEEHAKQLALNAIFHSLNPEGLFLTGNNESLGSGEHYFVSQDKQLRLYRKNVKLDSQPQSSGYEIPNLKTQSIQAYAHNKKITIENQLSHVICRDIINPIILIDNQDNIVYTLGKITEILDINNGPFDRYLMNLVKPEQQQVIRVLINRFRKKADQIKEESIVHHHYNQATMIIARQFDPHRPDWILLEAKSAKIDDYLEHEASNDSERQIFATIESELFLTKESLQLVIQELEEANQDLQSSNEKLQLMNEELILTNEELHSTNEELVTVNEELENKTYELHNTSSDLENLQTSIELPLIVIGKDFRVKRFVNAVYELLNHHQIQEGDLISALDWKNSIPHLKEKIEEVMSSRKRYRNQVHMGERSYQLYITSYDDENSHSQGAIMYFTDITRLTETQKALAEEQQRAHVTLENISDGVIRINNNMEIDYMNPAAEGLCGWRESDAIMKKVFNVVVVIDEETRQPLKDIFTPKGKQSEANIAVLINRNNEQLTIEYISTPLSDNANNRIGYLFVIRDVSERQAALKRVLWQSTHDHLTGLVNRQEMERRIEQSLVTAKTNNISSSFMFIDLDQFKIINDTCGHLAGDELLRRVTQKIMEQLRSRDTLARLGGDEFGVLLENCPLENAHNIAIKIRDTVSKYCFFWDDKLFKVGACIGLIGVSKETHSVSQLLRDADSACYAAKSNGSNSIQIHMDSDEGLSEQKEQMSIITDINDALENNRFRLYYQPIFVTATGEISHWEVLIRMVNRRYEFLLPHQFLPASERFGFIRQIDNWVIRQATKDLFELHKLTHKRPRLAINLSANTLSDNSSREELVELLKANQNLQGQLIFEITETSALSNIDSVNIFINQLRQYGCSLALDDFGTGVSTYSYLKRLDVDMIKIDGEFIHDITQNKINQEIVKSIVHIARLMNISTTAEWADSQDIQAYLTSINVDYLQGNYLGKPIPAEEFLSLVINQPAHDSQKETG